MAQPVLNKWPKARLGAPWREPCGPPCPGRHQTWAWALDSLWSMVPAHASQAEFGLQGWAWGSQGCGPGGRACRARLAVCASGPRLTRGSGLCRTEPCDRGEVLFSRGCVFSSRKIKAQKYVFQMIVVRFSVSTPSTNSEPCPHARCFYTQQEYPQGEAGKCQGKQATRDTGVFSSRTHPTLPTHCRGHPNGEKEGSGK